MLLQLLACKVQCTCYLLVDGDFLCFREGGGTSMCNNSSEAPVSSCPSLSCCLSVAPVAQSDIASLRDFTRGLRGLSSCF